jgi:predicted GIY-YIG superfamily endonuclease
MFYIYTLIDPTTNEIKYIGYTKNPKKRIWEHIRDAKKGIRTYKCEWIRSLLSKNSEPILEIMSEFDSHDKVLLEEIRLIKEFKESGSKLTNLTNGGDGQNGVKLRKDHPIIMWNKGREKSEETRRKLSISHKGKKLSSTHREKLSKVKLGKKRTEESINNQKMTMSEAIKVITPEGEVLTFSMKKDAVKFTGVNANQIDKLIKLNKKSKKGFLFEKIIPMLSI